MRQISYPLVNGASQGNYLPPKSHKLAKTAYKNSYGSQSCKLFYNDFWFWLDERLNLKGLRLGHLYAYFLIPYCSLKRQTG